VGAHPASIIDINCSAGGPLFGQLIPPPVDPLDEALARSAVFLSATPYNVIVIEKPDGEAFLRSRRPATVSHPGDCLISARQILRSSE
jgi:hypothetical protein